MARISEESMKKWKDVDRVDAASYVSEREVLRVAINDAQDQIDQISEGSIGLEEASSIKELANRASNEVYQIQTEVETVANEVSNVKETTTVHSQEIITAKDNLTLLNQLNPSIESFWEPPVMPDTLRNNGLVPSSYDPDVQLAAMFDRFVDNDYVTKRSIGRDNSNTYDIWCYTFTPEKPEKTILLTSLVHGNEPTGFYWLSQFMDLIVNHWMDYPQLAYLRKNVKFVTVPIVNPWGHMNQKRTNSSNVDISRNFSYNWGQAFDEYPQGPAPWSESEARAIRDLMAEIAPETVASLDFHTTLSEGDTHHILYYPRFLKNNVQPYLELVEDLKKAGETTAFASTALPTLTNWGILKHGFVGANPELKNGLAGSTRDSKEMTRAMRFFGNMVMQAAKTKGRNVASSLDTEMVSSIKFDHRLDGGPITFGTTSYTSQATKTAVKFKSKSEGIFEVQGNVIVSASVDAEVSILPQLYQVQSPDFGFAATSEDEFNAIIMNLKAGQEYSLPFSAEITCHKSNIKASNNTNDRAQEVVFQLRTKISAGTGTIKFIKAKAKMTPVTSGDRFARYGLNPARQIYPTGEGTGYEF